VHEKHTNDIITWNGSARIGNEPCTWTTFAEDRRHTSRIHLPLVHASFPCGSSRQLIVQ
jgi:hypothetical protein